MADKVITTETQRTQRKYGGKKAVDSTAADYADKRG